MADLRELQKPLLYNDHLPYAELLASEASGQLSAVLHNLSAAVQQSELWPGALFWTNRLHNYVRVYGHSFTKEEHVKLVHLLYALVTIPNLESPLLHTWCSLLTLLLKKWRLLTPDDLQLDWRPLYALSNHVFRCKYTDLGMRLYPPHTTNAVHTMIAHARNYFPLASTREMLDEWRPWLCPFDLAMVEGVSLCAEFLPNVFPPELHSHGFKLWFDEFLQLWLGVHGPTLVDEFFLKLFVRVAKLNVGYIDWTPHMPEIFSRVLRSFQLPVGPKELRAASSKDQLNTGKAAALVVCMLGGGGCGQEHLSRLMLALESYYHPSNLGKHTIKLLHFLKELALQFILRLKRERYSKPQWYRHIPEHAKLSEDDITRFVECLLPAVKMAMFSKFGTMEAAVTLNNLSLVRPELVLPDLLNSTYAALETVTEPHQVLSTLQCLTTTSRVLLSGGEGRYLEGRKQLMSLLMLALPGIDPNDYRKTLVSGLLISALLSSIPLVDCSSAVGKLELSEDEAELCYLSAQFEDFGLQLLDRCFALVENTRLEQISALDRFVSSVATNTQESVMGFGAAGTVHALLSQSSPQLFKVFLEKIYRFATSHVFESELAGRMCADMCAATAKVDSKSAFKLFIPHCVRTIAAVLEEPGQRESEHPDPTLLWTVHLLSQVVQGDGRSFLPYADQLTACLASCTHLKSKSAALHAAKSLRSLLHCLTSVYPLELCSTATGFSAPPDQHNYIKEWACAGDIEALGLQWHLPSEEELALADRLLHEFLQPELSCIEAMVERGGGEGEEGGMGREERYRCLQLVQYLLLGAATYLPMWSGPAVEGLPRTVVNMTRDFCICTTTDVKRPPEQFSRSAVAQTMHRLAEHVLSTCEDDTKTMFKLVEILKVLLTNPGIDYREFEAKWRVYKQSKKFLDNKLHGKKQAMRSMIIERICLQHELRMLERSMSPVTPLHLLLLKDLFKMSVSHYSEVRVKAQNALSSCFSLYLFSSRLLLPDLLPLLGNDGLVSHDQFKGALHVMLLPSVMTMFLHDWELLRRTLPVIVRADHSEKPTILAVMNKLLESILTKYEYAQLHFQVPERCLSAAEALHQAVSEGERETGRERLSQENLTALTNYDSLLDTLVDLIEQEKLQWRYSLMGMTLLVMLIRHDHALPVRGVRLIVSSLVHDSLAVRKLALKAVAYLLLQHKRPHLKEAVDIEKEAGCALSYNTPGEREDTKWLCYQPECLPSSEEQWDSFPFIDKPSWGYYTWPKTLYRYAPYHQQPALNRAKEELSESELVFYEALTSQEFVDRLFGFFSLEEVKGKDQFDVHKFDMFKGLARNFGSAFLPFFQGHLEKLAVDSQESHQRFASAVIAGTVSGSKHWNFQMVCQLRAILEPMLGEVLTAITPETVRDWSTCFTEISANRDPRRIHWLLELLMVDPLHGHTGSFNDASRLFLLQSCLAQQQWRVPPLLHRLLAYLRPHFTHPFKNVRERIGSVLAQVFMHDMPGVRFNPVRTQLLPLFSPAAVGGGSPLSPTSPHEKDTIKMADTVLMWLASSLDHSSAVEFQLLSQLLPLVTVEDDEELKALLNTACAQVAHAELSPPTARVVVDCLKLAMDTALWRVRVAVLHLLQVVVFKNLFLFSPLCAEVTELLLSSIKDLNIEVRELAASTLGGLVQCCYIQAVDKLKVLFINSARSKLPKRSKLAGSPLDTDTHYEAVLLERHSGVLGLAALVEACPYSVPPWLPAVIDEMALHLHDPAPIQGTVKKTMSEFRRTHYDNWGEHKKQFSDDQLAVLADLLISPSYYA